MSGVGEVGRTEYAGSAFVVCMNGFGRSGAGGAGLEVSICDSFCIFFLFLVVVV